jgi:WXG100 family type VII secretion target
VSAAVGAGHPVGMDGTISADHAAFRAAVGDLRRAADQLRDDRARVAGRADDLLGGGWRGVAASAWADGWADWTAAAARVLAALEAMGSLLEAAHEDLERADAAAAGSLGGLARRLG